MSKEKGLNQLRALLLELFPSGTLRTFVEQQAGGIALAQEVDWSRDSPAAHEFLMKAGDWLDEPFFEALATARSRSSHKIGAIYEEYFEKRFNFASVLGGEGLTRAEQEQQMGESTLRLLDLATGIVRDIEASGEGSEDDGEWLNTRRVFEAYRVLHPWLGRALKKDAVRPPASSFSGEPGDFLGTSPQLSRCVRLTVEGLCRSNARLGVPFDEHDVFFDLARYGAGRSVGRMRDAGFDVGFFNEQAQRLGIGQVTRHGPIDL